MISKSFFCKILVFILPLFLLVSCSGKNSIKNQIVNCNLESEPITLDPQVCNDTSGKIIISNIFEGLTKLDESGNVKLGVADSFKNNDNFTEFTFCLKKNIYWSCKDKKQLLAKDFEFAIKRALSKGTNSPNAHLLYCIKNAKKFNEGNLKDDGLGLKVIDDYTIKFTLEYSNKEFLKLMSEPVAMPCNEDFFKNSSGQYGVEADKILGNGAFRLSKHGWEHFKTINLVRNENYRDVKNVIPRGVTFFINKNSDNIIKSIKDKVFDISFIPSEKIKEAEKENLKILKTKENIFWGLVFNPENLLTANLNFRKSIVTSFNREYIFSALKEDKNLTPLKDLTNCKKLFFINTENNKDIPNIDFSSLYSGNPIEYLDNAIKESKIKNISGLTITCINNDVTKKLVSNMIQELNNKLNRHFNMLPVSKDELISRVNSKDYQSAIIPIKCDSNYLYDFLNLFKQGEQSSLVKINDPKYESYLKESLNSHLKNTQENVLKARNYIIHNIVFYPLYAESSYFLYSKNLNNIEFIKENGTINFSKAEKTK